MTLLGVGLSFDERHASSSFVGRLGLRPHGADAIEMFGQAGPISASLERCGLGLVVNEHFVRHALEAVLGDLSDEARQKVVEGAHHVNLWAHDESARAKSPIGRCAAQAALTLTAERLASLLRDTTADPYAHDEMSSTRWSPM